MPTRYNAHTCTHAQHPVHYHSLCSQCALWFPLSQVNLSTEIELYTPSIRSVWSWRARSHAWLQVTENAFEIYCVLCLPSVHWPLLCGLGASRLLVCNVISCADTLYPSRIRLQSSPPDGVGVVWRVRPIMMLIEEPSRLDELMRHVDRGWASRSWRSKSSSAADRLWQTAGHQSRERQIAAVAPRLIHASSEGLCWVTQCVITVPALCLINNDSVQSEIMAALFSVGMSV